MKVAGYEVPQAVIDACIARMEACTFRAADIARAAQRAGAPVEVSAGLANRIIRNMRLAKRIRLDDWPYWEWVT